MKIDIDQYNNLRLKEVFSGILLETEEGNQIGICMRDDTLEINVCPAGQDTNNWWRVNMQTGEIEKMTKLRRGFDENIDKPCQCGTYPPWERCPYCNADPEEELDNT